MADVFFARAVLIQEVEGQCARYSTDDESAILVTKSRDLNIVLPASENGPSIYIDVSPNDIEDVAVATLDEPSQLSPQVDRTVVALSIQLSSSPISSCYLNAARRHTKSIEIAFDNLDAANRVKALLEDDKDLDTGKLLVSRSANIMNVSQAEGDEMNSLVVSDDEIQALEQLQTTTPRFDDRTSQRPLPEDIIVSQGVEAINISQIGEDDGESPAIPNVYQGASKDLIATASQANALLRPRTTLEQPLRVEPNVDRVQHLKSPGGKGIQEIPLSQTLFVQGQVVPGFIPNPESALEKSCDKPVRQPEDTSEIELTSSIHWQRGRQLIDTAPEFDDTLPELSQQEVTKKDSPLNIDISPSGGHDEFADLYDASPRTLQIETQPSRPLHERIIRRSPTKDATEPDAGPNRSNKSSTKKLIQRLRNDENEGAAESSAAHSPENVGPVRREKTLETLKKSSSNRKLPQSIGNKKERQKQSKSQGKQQNSTSKSTKDRNRTTDAFDELDIPNSPPQAQKHKASWKVALKASTTKQISAGKGAKGEYKNTSSTNVLPNTYPLGSARRTEAGNKSSSHPGALLVGMSQERQAKSQASDAEAVNWNEDLEVDNEGVKSTSLQKEIKSTKGKSIAAEKGKRPKIAQANSTRKRAVKGKVPPGSLSQPRTRRAAALTAKRKIQNIVQSDASEMDEQTRTQTSEKDSRTNATGHEGHFSPSPASDGRLGSIDQKTTPVVTPTKSLDDQKPEDRAIFAPNMHVDESKLLEPQAELKTSPSDEIVLINDGNKLKNPVELKQGTLHQDDLGMISHVSENEFLSKNGALGLVLDETTGPGDLGILNVGNSHFHDAMADSAGNSICDSKSPVHEDKPHGSAVDSTSKENKLSDLHDMAGKQELESTVKTVHTSSSNSGGSWVDKLTGALSIIREVVEVHSHKSVMKTKYPTQHVPLDSSKVGAPKPTSGVLKSGGSTRADPQTSLTDHDDNQRRVGEPILNITKVVNIKTQNIKGHPQESIGNEPPATDTLHASPTIGPTSRASQIPPVKVIQISSEAEDSSDESSLHDPDIANDTTSSHTKSAAHDPRAEVNTPRPADTKSQIPKARMMEHQSATMPEPEQHKMEMENLQTRTNRTNTIALPKTSEGIEPQEHIPDPARKSILISFSAEGPRNQGIASGQKAQPLRSSERQDHHPAQPKKLRSPKFEKDEETSELPPKDLTPLERLAITQTGSHQAQDLPSEHRERRIGKLTSKLQKAIPTMKRNEISNSFSSMNSAFSAEETMNNTMFVVENLSIAPKKTSPAVRANLFAAIADMNYNPTGEEANKAGDEVSTRTLNVVPAKFPNTAILQENRSSSLARSRIVHPARRETKRHAEATVVDVLNEVAFGKRRKLSSKAAFAGETAAESVSKQIGSVERDTIQRTGGSQSTRVDENGSPLPFTHSRHIDISSSQPRLTQDIIRVPIMARPFRDEDEITQFNDKTKLDDATAPLRKASRTPNTRKFPLEPLKNSKLQSSPSNAPSSIVDEMEPHHIDLSGKFINVETENVITSHEPPDPFLGTTHGQPNTFMQALRRAGERTHKQLETRFTIPYAHVTKSSRMVHHAEDEDDQEDDQDITLVEPESQDEHSQTASETSSTSPSSHSKEGSPSEKRSISDNRSGCQDQWRKALQPHQGKILEVLYDISHVSSPSPFPYHIIQY